MLKAIIDNLEDVDSKYQDLYEEKDGKYMLKQIEGLRTQADVDRVQSALTKERNDHKAVRSKLQAFGDLDPFKVREELDRIPELEELAKGRVDDAKIEKMVETRLRTVKAPLERELNETKKKLSDIEAQAEMLRGQINGTKIADEVRKAATKLQILPSAIDDALLLGERVLQISEDGRVIVGEGKGFTEGVTPEVFLTELKEKRPHWWPSSGGGGGRGGDGSHVVNNPWSAEHWNMTEQARIYKADKSRAEQLARSAGTSIGGSKPSPKK